MSAEGLPAPAEREPVHERSVQFRSYRRSDGLWDIEATLTDQRCYASFLFEKGPMAVGEPIHDIRVRVTVDDAMVVKSVAATMVAVPYHTCPGALAPLASLEGGTLGSGWRKRIDACLGGTRSCTHLRELLAQVASAAYQTIPVWHAQRSADVLRTADGTPPPHLGTCTTWAFEGPVVARIYPEFARRGDGS